MDFIDVVGWFTLCATLFMFSTGIPPCIHMYKTGSTRNVPFSMFLIGGIGCLHNLHYGVMLDNVVLIFLNAVGSFLQVLYVFAFLAVVQPKAKSVMNLVATVIYFIMLYAYLYKVVIHPEQIVETMGIAASLTTSVMMVLPAFEIYDNVQNKNADGMPMIMLLGGIVCCASWLVYGTLLQDMYITAPNVPGLVLFLSKLMVVQRYKSKVD